MIEAGGYTLHIRCDGDHEIKPGMSPQDVDKHCSARKTWAYCHHTHGACMKLARRAGWLFKRDGTTLCPYCTGRRT